ARGWRRELSGLYRALAVPPELVRAPARLCPERSLLRGGCGLDLPVALAAGADWACGLAHGVRDAGPPGIDAAGAPQPAAAAAPRGARARPRRRCRRAPQRGEWPDGHDCRRGLGCRGLDAQPCPAHAPLLVA